MTERDIDTVATCIRVQTFEMPGQTVDPLTARRIAEALALEFYLDDPIFDMDKFIVECGFDVS